jgi:hypothetical protein
MPDVELNKGEHFDLLTLKDNRTAVIALTEEQMHRVVADLKEIDYPGPPDDEESSGDAW